MTPSRPTTRAVCLRLLGWRVWLIDNRPVWALSWLRWSYPEEGRAGWRLRVGPLKAEGSRP